MALASTVVWEIRTDGSDANGGGFDPTSGTPGTDYSQQAAAQIAYTDLVIDGTTNTKCTSALNPFTAAHVGNIINVTGGTGFTVQRVQIMSVAAGVATVDKSLGTLSSTGGTGKLGGAMATVQSMSGLAVAGNKVYVKNGTYTFTSTWTQGTLSDVWFIGYDTTRTLNNTDTRPLITTSTNSTVLFTCNANGSVQNVYYNIRFSNTASTRADFIVNSTAVSYLVFINCSFDGFNIVLNNSSATLANNALASFFGCELKNSVSDAIVLTYATKYFLDGCYIHSNGGMGIKVANGATDLLLSNSIIANNTGRGVQLLTSTAVARFRSFNSTFYKNGTANIEASSVSTGAVNWQLVNNVVYGSTKGIVGDPSGMRYEIVRKNAIGGASSANYTDFTAGADDIVLSVDPFTNGADATGDFSLVGTGGGAQCRAVGWPIALPGTANTNYLDLGAVQVMPAIGGGSSVFSS